MNEPDEPVPDTPGQPEPEPSEPPKPPELPTPTEPGPEMPVPKDPEPEIPSPGPPGPEQPVPAEPDGPATPYVPSVGAVPIATAPPEPPDLWDAAADWFMARGALPALGLITLVMIALYGGVFRGELAGDDLSFHMAESARLADCLSAGDFDFWNPSGNGGFASAYYYQVVPQLISAIPAAVFGHHLFFFQLSVFLPLVLAPAAAYRGMRLLGATQWQSVIAGLAVGFLNGESRWGTGNAGTFNVGLYTQTWALAAFPIAFGHAVRWATEARGLAPSIAWGAFVTMCHPFAGVALAIALFFGYLTQIGLLAIDALFKRPGPPRPLAGELVRLAILGVCLAITWMPIWLPLEIDHEGFGAFPHRVADEVGPGVTQLGSWYIFGQIFDSGRPMVLTAMLPVVIVFARARWVPWIWTQAIIYAALLALGPHIGKTGADDLFPMVRFLGPLQVVCALAIGAGVLMLATRIWEAREGSWLAILGRIAIAIVALSCAVAYAVSIWNTPDASVWPNFGNDSMISVDIVRIGTLVVLGGLTGYALWWVWKATRVQYGLRTAIAAALAALCVLLTVPGARALFGRVHVLADYEGSHGDELHDIVARLQHEPPGRKQVGTGAESHWWNLLSYEYGRRPSLLMMGGGGLQSSPNYDFLWSVKDVAKSAWVYDAPILVFQKSNNSSMPAGQDIYATKNYQVRRLPAPGLVSPVQVTGTLPAEHQAAHDAAIDWLRSDQPLKDRVMAYVGYPGLASEPHGKTLRSFRQDSPGDEPDIVAEVDVTAPTTFIARESWHPRWLAYIDGKAAPVRRVTPEFPAVDVPAGHHLLTFRFARPWWAQADWLAWPLVPLAAWLITRRRRAS